MIRFRNAIFILLAAGIGALFLVLLLRSRPVTLPAGQSAVIIGQTTIPVSVAATEPAREQGLSGIAVLPSDKGKLFVFDKPGAYGFWMKNMQFALDMIWIDQYGHIVAITRDVSPSSYPDVFTAPTAVQYVLEVNAGFSTAHAIEVGTQVQLLY